MGHCFSHLTKTDRFKLDALLRHGVPKKEIASELHVHVSTIYRELKRCPSVVSDENGNLSRCYNPEESEKRYRDYLALKGPDLKYIPDEKFSEYLRKKIVDEHYSPAAALHDIPNLGLSFNTSICVKTLYNYIDKGVFNFVSNSDLPEKPKRKKSVHISPSPKRASYGESIEKRSPVIDSRSTFGHWEMDTVYGKKEASKDCLLVLTERLTRKEIIIQIPDRTAYSVVFALNNLEKKYSGNFSKIFKSITVDNGGEFSDVPGLENSFLHDGMKRTKLFYCHPYSSYERGSNENLNRMIRRRFPKGTDFAAVSPADVALHETWINRYPRKILGWKSADSLFTHYVSMISGQSYLY